MNISKYELLFLPDVGFSIKRVLPTNRRKGASANQESKIPMFKYSMQFLILALIVNKKARILKFEQMYETKHIKRREIKNYLRISQYHHQFIPGYQNYYIINMKPATTPKNSTYLHRYSKLLSPSFYSLW